MNTLVKFLLPISAVLIGAPVAAQPGDWPGKTLRLVVPFPPGGSTDVLARALAQKLGARLSKTVVVENISGGATVPAVQNVLRADSDGSTLLLSSDITFSVNPHMMRAIPYAPAKDFVPVTILGTAPNWLMVRSDRSEKTIADLARTIAAHPGTVTIGVNGIGGAAQLGLESWKKAANLDFTVVPYRGSPPAVADLMGGQITATVDVVGSSLQHVKGGKLKALGLLQDKRDPLIKDLPAGAEGGALAPRITTYFAIAVKAGAPADRLQRLNQAIKESASEADYRKLMADLVIDPVLNSPADAAAYIKSETDRYGALVKQSGMKPQ